MEWDISPTIFGKTGRSPEIGEVFSWNIYVLAGGAQREVIPTWLETVVFIWPVMIPWIRP
jgi:hypothetical protein